MTVPLSCGRKTAPFRPCDGMTILPYECMTVLQTDTPTDRPLRHPSAALSAIRNNRHEYCCFLFSQVQSFKNGSAHFRSPERFDAESEGGYRFEVVNLHAASVRQADKAFDAVLFQNSAFAESLYPCPNRWGGYPEQSADSPLGHGGCAYVGRQGDIALPVHRDDVPFFFHRYAVLRELNGSADILLHLLQLVRQGFHVLTYLLVGDYPPQG